MAKRKFEVSYIVSVEVEIEEGLIAGVLTDEWRGTFYGNVKTPEDVARHLAYNYLRNHIDDPELLDGFADRTKSDVRFTKDSWDDAEVTQLK